MLNKLGIPLFLIITFACTADSNYLPENFYALRLTKIISGEEARSFVNNLHTNSVADLENEIGFYKGKRGSSIIYITGYPSEEKAIEGYDEMTGKIAAGNPVFINPGFINLNGFELFHCFGLGQSHYVFSFNEKLFWISVDSHFAQKFIAEYLDYIN